jgi:hypothetical protein
MSNICKKKENKPFIWIDFIKVLICVFCLSCQVLVLLNQSSFMYLLMQRSLKWPPYNCVLCLYYQNRAQTFAKLKVSVYVKWWAKALFYPKVFYLTDQPKVVYSKALHLNLQHIKCLMKLLAGVPFYNQ